MNKSLSNKIVNTDDVVEDVKQRIVFIEKEIATGGKGYEPALILYTRILDYMNNLGERK